MSSTLTPRHGSWAPCVIHIFLVCSVPSFLSSATMSLAVIYFLPQVACNAQSALRLAFAGSHANAKRRVDPLRFPKERSLALLKVPSRLLSPSDRVQDRPTATCPSSHASL